VLAAQGEPGPFAELVHLLVGEPAAAEDADGVFAVLGLDRADPVGDVVEGGLPGDGLAVQERGREPRGVVEQFGRGPALLARRRGVTR
jgi:hypothetical protein